MMRRLGVVIVVTALVVLGVGTTIWAMRGVLAERLFAGIYDHAMATDGIGDLPDGLHVGLCGSGSPMPDPTRAGPCTAIVAGRDLFIVDSGTGSTKNLSLMNLPPAQVTGIFIECIKCLLII